ncbi:NUDIX hydrolase [Candidatus Saccharibacteria bacterium]|nr:NUDIX hydrolase [Candidatus Saccharibacteria bacterium]
MEIAVGTVIIKDGKILMVQEAQNSKHEQCYKQWCVPTGHLEKGEHIQAAAIREAKEETGYDIKLKNLLAVFSVTNYWPLLIYFIGEVISGKPKFDKNEILDVKWVSLDELNNYDLRLPLKVMNVLLDRVKNNELYPLDVIKELKGDWLK